MDMDNASQIERSLCGDEIRRADRYQNALGEIVALERRWKKDSDGTSAFCQALEIAKKALGIK
jgi:hypothetical protein